MHSDSARAACPPRQAVLPEAIYACLPSPLCRALDAFVGEPPSELRLRAGRYASFTVAGRNVPVPVVLTGAELQALLLALCGGSLYAFRDPLSEGYLDLGGGVRLGIAGRAVTEGGRTVGVTDVSSLVFRLPRCVDTAGELARAELMRLGGRGLLVFSRPGVGKTTLLRDLARRLSEGRHALRTVLVDSRGELSSGAYGQTALLDILVGYPKDRGIEQAVRTLSPEVILLDEIGSRREAEAILAVAGCGVTLVATAHAGDWRELAGRAAIRPLLRAGVFGGLLGLQREGERVLATPYPWPPETSA